MSKQQKAKPENRDRNAQKRHNHVKAKVDPLARFTPEEKQAYSNWILIGQKIEAKIKLQWPSLSDISMAALVIMMRGDEFSIIEHDMFGQDLPVYEEREYRWFIDNKLAGLLKAQAINEAKCDRLLKSGLVK